MRENKGGEATGDEGDRIYLYRFEKVLKRDRKNMTLLSKKRNIKVRENKEGYGRGR